MNALSKLITNTNQSAAYDLNSFVKHLGQMQLTMIAGAMAGLATAAEVIEKDAKDQIGEYQPDVGPFSAWPELAERTEDEKARLGYALDAPLLREGNLRDSIQHEVRGFEAVVGSTSPIAAYQEFGTERIPPRPFIGPAVFKNKLAIQKIIGSATVRGLCMGGAIPSGLYDHEI